MAGLGMKHVGSKGVTVMTSVLKMMQGAYPEVIENIFIVSAPWVFSTLWRLVKPFVAPRTIEKIKIMGTADTAVRSVGCFVTYTSRKRYPMHVLYYVSFASLLRFSFFFFRLFFCSSGFCLCPI